MDILVTGSTGFFGRTLLSRLIELKANHELNSPQINRIFALRPPSRSSSNLASDVHDVELVNEELMNNVDRLRLTFERIQPDVVVHLAAAMVFYPKDSHDEQHMFQVNVEGTRQLFEALATAHLSKRTRFLYISSTEAIGSTNNGTEESPLKPDYPYGVSKVEAEKAIRSSWEDLGEDKKQLVEYVILRTTGLYGPGDDHAMFQFMGMVNSGLLCFYPEPSHAKICFTYVSDGVQGILCCFENPNARNETFIISTDDEKDYKWHIDQIANALGRRIYHIHLPLSLVRFIVFLTAPLLNLLFGIDRVFMYHPDTVDAMGKDRLYHNDKAKRLLGFKPRYSFPEGIQETIQWYRKRGVFSKSPFSVIEGILLFCVFLFVFVKLYH